MDKSPARQQKEPIRLLGVTIVEKSQRAVGKPPSGCGDYKLFMRLFIRFYQ